MKEVVRDTAPEAEPAIVVSNLRRSFAAPGSGTRRVVDVPAFSLETTGQAVITGPSGSGKSTFLHLLAGLLSADADSSLLRVAGADLRALDESGRDRHRAARIGCVFQSFLLLDGHDVLENVILGAAFRPRADFAAHGGLAAELGAMGERDRALALLGRVGLRDATRHLPRQLSVGMRQRVAVARALMGLPALVLADEPAASLDPARAVAVVDLLSTLCRDAGAALLVVAHDPVSTAALPRRIDWATLNRAEGAAEP